MIIQESGIWMNSFFSEDDIYINFNDFKSKKRNFILITGLSGSGKSTLGKEVAKKYKAEYVELDAFNFGLVKRNPAEKEVMDRIKSRYLAVYTYIQRFHKKDPDWMYKYFNNKKIPLYDRKTFAENEGNKFIDLLINDYKKRCVIEGVFIATYISQNNKTRFYPIIFKGTSKYTSMLRMMKRNGMLNFDSILDTLGCADVIKTFYDDSELAQNHARHTIMNNNYIA